MDATQTDVMAGFLRAASNATAELWRHRVIIADSYLRNVRPLFDAEAKKILGRRGSAPDYNVFRITGRAHLEVSTHQEMVADLLNPLGVHGQGGLFLERFLRILKEKCAARNPGAPLPLDPTWMVSRNRDRVDVALRHRSVSIVIETKWDHHYTNRQLERYWVEERCRRRFRSHAVLAVYLTKNGEEPFVVRNGVRIDVPPTFAKYLVCISFREHFASMLTESLKEIGSPRVQGALEQYIDVLKGG